MYKIVGSDGKEYGPVGIEQMRQWITQGRVNAWTRVQAAGSEEWKTAADFPELGFASTPGVSGPGSAPPTLPVGQIEGQQKGMAITSFVLGLLSLVCFGLLAGIPAIICGHVARGRVRQAPRQYGGAGFALAGLIMGYVSTVLTLVILPAMLLPALSQAKARAQRISCVNNMKQIGLAFRVWAIDHEDSFPFNVSTNKGGSLELCSPGSDGFDRNAAFHFRVMSNELSTPKILLCPADTKAQSALIFENLQAANVSYQLYSGTNVSETNPSQVLAICPIHNNVLMCDGSVQSASKSR
jgi:prepilin-type processing-associated H-X9-DG protein